MKNQNIERDIGQFFGVAAEQLPPAPAAVLVKTGARLLRIPADEFQQIFVGAFAVAADQFGDFPGKLTADGLRVLATEARRAGFADNAGKLDALRAGMTGVALVLTEDGQPWRPVKRPVKTVGPTPSASSAGAELVRATAEEIAEFFEEGHFPRAQGKGVAK